jgi:hypothetical protein
VVCRYTDGAVAARWFGQERGTCQCTMRRRCGGRELDDHAEAGDLALALEARPDDRAVEKGGPNAWATAGPRCDPFLAPRRDGVEFVGSSGKTNGWDASTSAESERDGDGVMDDEGARVPAGGRTRGDIGLGGCARKHRAGRFGGSSKTAPNSVLTVFPKLPPLKIPEGRVATSGRLRRVEANISKSS